MLIQGLLKAALHAAEAAGDHRTGTSSGEKGHSPQKRGHHKDFYSDTSAVTRQKCLCVTSVRAR